MLMYCFSSQQERPQISFSVQRPKKIPIVPIEISWEVVPTISLPVLTKKVIAAVSVPRISWKIVPAISIPFPWQEVIPTIPFPVPEQKVKARFFQWQVPSIVCTYEYWWLFRCIGINYILGQFLTRRGRRLYIAVAPSVLFGAHSFRKEQLHPSFPLLFVVRILKVNSFKLESF